MANKNRRVTPKGMLEKETGRKIDPNLLPAIHKVQILEYLLSCPASELHDYQHADMPEFIFEAAKLLDDGKLLEFIQVLNLCRIMAREDGLNTK